MKNIILVSIAFFLFFNTAKGQQIQVVEKASSVSFKIKNFGLWVDGTLGDIKVTGRFDTEDLTNSDLTATVEVQTINTGISSRDTHLKTAEYFNANRYPTIKIQSTQLYKKGGKYYFKGKLTIKGKTQTIFFPFTVEKKEQGRLLSGMFDLNRLDFGVGTSSYVLSDKVVVRLNIFLTEAPAN